MEPHRPDKKGNPLEKALIQLTKDDDLKNIGDLLEKAQELDIKNFENLYTDKFLNQLHLPGLIALIMITPLQKAPSFIFSLVSSAIYTNSFIKDNLTKIPENFQFSIAMRFANAACLCNKGSEVLRSEGFSYLNKTNPTIYTPPLLYIHAQIKEPFIPSIQYRKEGRIDTMALYYLGLNYMLMKNFHEAEFIFTKSYLLSKSCKDIRPSIIHKLSLASFLNHTPAEVFFKSLPQKHHPTSVAGSLWTLKPIDSSQLDGYYREFEREITSEATRRIILDFAETCTAILSKDLAKACSIKQTELKKALDELKKSQDIDFNVTQEGVVEFTSVAVTQPVNTELQVVSKLLNNIKGE